MEYHLNGKYPKPAIMAFRKSLAPIRDEETFSDYLANATTKFKDTFRFWRPDDLAYFRCLVGNLDPRIGIAPMPSTFVRTLSDTFDAHIFGDEAGVGWHSERNHANGTGNWSYRNHTWLSKNKGTYYAKIIQLKGEAKRGNNGFSSFFPADMPINDIRSGALFVANTVDIRSGSIITGLDRIRGIRIDCQMSGGEIVSAYPHVNRGLLGE